MPEQDEVFAQEDAAAGSTSQGVAATGGRNDSGANAGGRAAIGTSGAGASTGGTNDTGRSGGTSNPGAGGDSGGSGVSSAGARSGLVGAGASGDSGSGGASSVAASGGSTGGGTSGHSGIGGASSAAASGGSNGGGTGSGGEPGSGGNGGTGGGGLGSGGTGGGELGSGGNGGTGGGELGTSGTGAIVGAVGLVAYYPFDEASGQVAANLMDATMNATYVGGCTHPKEGAIGGAVRIRNMGGNEFTSEWIELPEGILSDLSEATLSIWVRDLSSARWGGRLFDFSRGVDEAIYFAPDDVNPETSVQGSHLGGIHDGAVFVDVWSTTPTFTDQAWHHVAVAWSSSSVVLYIDGRAMGGTEVSGPSPSDLGVTSPNWLGRTLDDAQVGLYAEIDELRIYDRVLADSDIAQLYRMR